jgi:hypothetical protein
MCGSGIPSSKISAAIFVSNDNKIMQTLSVVDPKKNLPLWFEFTFLVDSGRILFLRQVFWHCIKFRMYFRFGRNFWIRIRNTGLYYSAVYSNGTGNNADG